MSIAVHILISFALSARYVEEAVAKSNACAKMTRITPPVTWSRSRLDSDVDRVLGLAVSTATDRQAAVEARTRNSERRHMSGSVVREKGDSLLQTEEAYCTDVDDHMAPHPSDTPFATRCWRL